MSDRALWEKIMSQPQAKYPREDFVRFMARNYYHVPNRHLVNFLDLGCGAGANSLYLLKEGFPVDAIDRIQPSMTGLTAFPGFNFQRLDLTEWEPPTEKYDCALDNSTLCHIEDAPKVVEKVWHSLKPNGKIFSVWPTNFNRTDAFIDKGFCRRLSAEQGDELFSNFDTQVGRLSYTDFGSMRTLTYWLIEGTKK